MKYQRNSRTREKLADCMEFRADSTIKQAALARKDDKILAMVMSKDLISSEAKYHKSCYKVYVRTNYVQPANESDTRNQEENDYKRIESQAFESIIEYCIDLIEQPRLVEFIEVRAILTDELEKNGHQATEATKKNLKRKILSTIQRINLYSLPNGRLIMYPSSLTFEMLIKEIISMKEEIKVLKGVSLQEKTVINSALLLRSEIKEMKGTISWPPAESDLTISKVTVGKFLMSFLKTLLSGKVAANLSQNIQCRLYSYAQDLIYGVTNGRLKTVKSILLTSVITSLTNNTEVINILNRLGHCISYTSHEELETQVAMEALRVRDAETVFVPKDIVKNSMAILVFDNIDRLEETLSGEGTSHRVNGILIQEQEQGTNEDVLSNKNEVEEPPSKRPRQRTLHGLHQQDLPCYTIGKRSIRACAFVFSEQIDDDGLFELQRRWWVFFYSYSFIDL